jgi:hypothetical protein
MKKLYNYLQYLNQASEISKVLILYTKEGFTED